MIYISEPWLSCGDLNKYALSCVLHPPHHGRSVEQTATSWDVFGFVWGFSASKTQTNVSLYLRLLQSECLAKKSFRGGVVCSVWHVRVYSTWQRTWQRAVLWPGSASAGGTVVGIGGGDDDKEDNAEARGDDESRNDGSISVPAEVLRQKG